MSRIGRTWELTKQSFHVLKNDKRLLVFPVLSAIAVVLVSASYAVPVVMTGALNFQRGQPATNTQYLLLFGFYFVNYFVIVFFNSARVYCASICLSGGHATVSDGLKASWDRLGAIFTWALLAATVGMILRIIEDRLGKWARLVTWLLGTAWALATYFIVAVLVFEDLGIADSVRRSTRVLKDTWGEEAISGLSFGLIWLGLIALGVVAAFALISVQPLLGIAAGVLYFIVLAVVASAVKTIFTVALYRYASQRQVPEGFSPELIQTAFGTKKSVAAGA